VVPCKDLVVIKQTQRNRDWELRSPELLIEAVTRYPEASQNIATGRPAVQAALSGDIEQVRAALRIEQDEAMRKDRIWWEPLKRELEQFRHQR
jgi:hypothetical protein